MWGQGTADWVQVGQFLYLSQDTDVVVVEVAVR